mmetsp:Transcript_71351/g.220546  ORF Transcript_71351/g.220546 Transcript_71351/m.220546 type:complete len:257 (+) Transcript_71351:1065-1835(+)
MTSEELEAAALQELNMSFAGVRDLPEPKRHHEPVGNRKVRILALHANGSNSNVMKFQTSKMRKAFGKEFQWIIPDGLEPWEPLEDPPYPYLGEKSEIEKRLAGGKPFVQWWRPGDSETYWRAVRWLLAFTHENGPIDVIVSFSDSSPLVNRVTDEHQKIGLHVPWRSAVMCNGALDPGPFCSDPPFWPPAVCILSPAALRYHEQLAQARELYRDPLVLEHGDGFGFPVSEPGATELYERLVAVVRAECGISRGVAC